MLMVYHSEEGVITTGTPHMMLGACGMTCSLHGRSARRNLAPKAGPSDKPQAYPGTLYLLAPYVKGLITTLPAGD